MKRDDVRRWLLACTMLLPACERELPRFPDVGPYLHQPECVACLEEKCATEFSDCMDDDADAGCAQEYECRGNATDPTEHMACANQRVSSQEQARRFAEGDETDAGPDLGSCATTQCAKECAIGRDFSCVGQYEPTGAAERIYPVGRNFLDFTPIDNLRLSICQEVDGNCSTPIDVFDASGGAVEVVLPQTGSSPNNMLKFHQEPPESTEPLLQYPSFLHAHTLPWTKGMTAIQLMLKREVFTFFWEAQDLLAEFNEGGFHQPVVWIGAQDCANNRAAGLRLETDASCQPFDRCDFFGSGLTTDPSLTETVSDAIVSTVFVAEDASNISVRFVDTETGFTVSSKAITPVREAVLNWYLYPHTRRQAEQAR